VICAIIWGVATIAPTIITLFNHHRSSVVARNRSKVEIRYLRTIASFEASALQTLVQLFAMLCREAQARIAMIDRETPDITIQVTFTFRGEIGSCRYRT
jgi:hypothetical protein